LTTDAQRIVKIYYDRRYSKAAFVDWRCLESSWQNNRCQQLRHYALKPCYYSRWFVRKENEECFELADVDSCSERQAISFINGRHRVSVLKEKMAIIPLAYEEEDTLKFFKKTGAFLRNADYGEEFSIPNLPVLSIDELRK